MFVRKQDEAAAFRASDNYKMVQSGNIIYVYPEDATFQDFVEDKTLAAWANQAVLVIDNRTGDTRKNRYGPISQVSTWGAPLQ